MDTEEANNILESWGNTNVSHERADGFADGYDYAIESRVCENCEYFRDIEKSYRRCDEVGVNVMGDFGCNLFKSNESI